jgi:thioredoxin-like negative regulator of GroEL
MKAELDTDPANNELRLNIAQYAIDNNLYEDAIEALLDVSILFRCFSFFQKIIKIDRNFKNRTANNKLVELFNKLGSTNPLVVQGRKKMQKILY